MKNLEKLKEVLSDIEITEEQEKALNDFFEEFIFSIEDRISSNFFEELKEKEAKIKNLKRKLKTIKNKNDFLETIIENEKSTSTEDMIPLSEFELLKEELEREKEREIEKIKLKAKRKNKKILRNSQKAFELFESDVKKAFKLFEEDTAIATEAMKENLQNIYAEKSMKAIEDLYETIENEVKEKFKNSREWNILNNIKETVTPLVLEESEDDLAKKIVDLANEKEALYEEVENLKKKELIKSLVSDFPEKEAKIIQEFIEKGKNENEIYERFSSIIEILETKINKDEENKKEDFFFDETIDDDYDYKDYDYKDYDYKDYDDYDFSPKKKWKKPKSKKIFSESLKYKKKKNKKTKKENKNILTEMQIQKPFFESKSFENNKNKEEERIMLQPYEEKIIEQVFGN